MEKVDLITDCPSHSPTISPSKRLSSAGRRTLTFVPQCEAAHLREVLEGLQTDHSSVHLQPGHPHLVLLDEAWSHRRLLPGLFVNQADQHLYTTTVTQIRKFAPSFFQSGRSAPVQHNSQADQKICTIILSIKQISTCTTQQSGR